MTCCNKHPKYRAIRKPRVPCESCWRMWFGICDTCINCGCQQAELEQELKYMEEG